MHERGNPSFPSRLLRAIYISSIWELGLIEGANDRDPMRVEIVVLLGLEFAKRRALIGEEIGIIRVFFLFLIGCSKKRYCELFLFCLISRGGKKVQFC